MSAKTAQLGGPIAVTHGDRESDMRLGVAEVAGPVVSNCLCWRSLGELERVQLNALERAARAPRPG